MRSAFKFEEIDDFDKHISLSIPSYSELSNIFSSVASALVQPNGLCIDIGCSTGRFLHTLTKAYGAKYIGIDVVSMNRRYDDVEVIRADCEEYLSSINSADVVVSMFTLQFLGKNKRSRTVKELARLCGSGATILIAEKVFLSDTKISDILCRSHTEWKREKFSDKEILDKASDLNGVMFCENDKDIQDELNMIGIAIQVWQVFGFKGWVIIPRKNGEKK